MTVNIDHPWSTRPLSDEEIAEVEKENAELRQDPQYRDMSYVGRTMYRIMDSIYIRALRRGQNMEEARTAAPNLLFAFAGAVMGWALCAVMFGIGSLLWGYATTGHWISFSITAFWCVILFLLVTGFIHKRIVRLLGKVKERRHKPEDD